MTRSIGGSNLDVGVGAGKEGTSREGSHREG